MILESDIKFVKSQVLEDVPEGGGAATGQIVVDAASNNLYPGLAELDHVYGSVALRKIFLKVDTPNRDKYLKSNVIIADAPGNPDVTTVIFDTQDAFDTRKQAAARVESYLAQGAAYQGLLFGNHIAGQMTVTLIQRETVPLPVVGGTLVLRKNEGLITQVEQFVRITDVSSMIRSFSDQFGADFSRRVITLEINAQLDSDFPGFGASRYDSSVIFTNLTKIYETMKADAARYYGIAPLVEAVSGVDPVYVVKAQSIFTQLVPSSRAELPIADARVNQASPSLIAAGAPIIQNFTTVFSATQPIYIGGGQLPGSVSISAIGIIATDEGGLLKSSGVTVGTFDYENGIGALSTDIYGTVARSFTITATPAAVPSIVTDSIGLPVTQANQRANWTVTLDPAPANGTLMVSYMAQGGWYVMREDGSGGIRGADPSVGAGTLNPATGTVSITLGALPDIGSRIIFQFSRKESARVITQADLDVNAKFTFMLDFGIAIKPGGLNLSWNDGVARTAHDVNGALTDAAAGIVYYAAGRVMFAPNVVPPKGTIVSATVTSSELQDSEIAAFIDSGGTWTKTVPAPIRPNSFEMSVVGQLPVREYPGVDVVRKTLIHVLDDGAGSLYTPIVGANLNIGVIDYATGAIALNKLTGGYAVTQGKWVGNIYMAQGGPLGPGSLNIPKVLYLGTETRSVILQIENGPGSDTIVTPMWAWFPGAQGSGGLLRYSGADGTSTTQVFSLDSMSMQASAELISPSDGVWGPIRFTFGGELYTTRNNLVLKSISPTTGEGIAVGTTYGLAVTLNDWPSLVTPMITTVSGATLPPTSGVLTRMLSDGVTFRTASSPLVSTGFSIQGEFEDGITFNVSADEDGILNSGGVVGVVDFQTGVAEIRFGTPTVEPEIGVLGVLDLSYLGIPGVTFVGMKQARTDTLRYNAVAYSFLPLDADILGLNPVRLPSDGRVPIFRKGMVVVIHHTVTTSTFTASNSQTLDLGRSRVARVRVIGNDDLVIVGGYTVDLDAGTMVFTDIAGYSQPIKVENRVEDMAIVADAQINGLIRLTRQLTHEFPLGSYISSALITNTLFSRVSLLFDQSSWGNFWDDNVSGDPSGGTYNVIDYPAQVTNQGAITERWALVFNATTTYRIYGEHLGLIGDGNLSFDCAPLNPNTGTPYFTLPKEGFGGGWSAGNTIRLNTVGALAPLWLARVVQQGDNLLNTDSSTLLARGDVDI